MNSNAPTLMPLDRSRVLLLRAKTKAALVNFVMLTRPKFEVTAVHEQLASKLEQCYERKIRQLCIVTSPEDDTISELIAVEFPAWALTNDPTLNILVAGYADGVSDGYSKACERMLTGPRNLQIFDELLDPR